MSVMLPEKQARLDELFSAASEMTDPMREAVSVFVQVVGKASVPLLIAGGTY